MTRNLCKPEITDTCLLLAVDLEGDWSHDDLAAQAGFPKELAGFRIESVEVAFAAAGEDKVGCGGEKAAVGDIKLVKLPAKFTGLRIHGHDGATADFIGPIINWAAAANTNGRRIG